MKGFAYARPTELDQALRLLGRDRAVALAGGTDLLSLMKASIETPDLLVDIKEIPDLRVIEEGPTQLTIGAAVTLAALIEHPRVRELSAIRDAISGIQSPQIRNMGTVGGELCQRPRCWYYRSGLGLLARRDSSSRLEQGDSRYHAIFGAGPAFFVHPSSLAPALVALDARLIVASRDGEREIAVAELYRAPQTAQESELTLEPQELIRKILVPLSTPEAHSASYEVRSQQALSWPLVGCAVSLRFERGVLRDPRVVLGHVAPTPWRCPRAEQVLQGQKLDRRLAEEASAAALEGARPLGDNGYKIQLARVATQRALLAAMPEGARG